jgi:putative ABC transport system permease protein
MHEALVEQVRPAILALMGAVLFLLLIACANVANLLLVRTSLRETELAVRSALGAESWRLVRQLLVESLVLAALGTIVGVALAWIGLRVLIAVAPANLPRLAAVTIDPWVVAFAALTGLAAAAVFGVIPALRTSRLDVMTVLRGSSRTEGLGRGTALRSVVVVAEVALCFVLLIGSGLMFRSFLELQRINLGFDPNGVLTFQLLGGRGGPPPQRAAVQRDLEQRLRALPGVQSVTASFPFPLAGGFSTIRWGTEEALADNSKYQAVDWQRVLPGYFEALRTPLLDGRTFTDADNDPGRSVVIVDQVLAQKAFPNQSAVGKRILIRIRTVEPEWVEIIGVVGHQRLTSIADPGREELFVTDGFLGHGGARKWAIRAAGDPSRLIDAVRATVARVDPQLLMTDIRPMTTLVYEAQAGTRFSLLLIGIFAVVAALLVGVGLYGVLSTVVRQRTPEIGVRMALGAAPANIQRFVLGYGVRLSVVGMVLGIVAAFALTRLMTTMLVGVRPTDPATYGAMAIVFLMIAGLSTWLPARRAASVDPLVALRCE